jgi:site-specific DNA-adenine methylase
MAKTIVSFFPQHGRIYLEPFAGRGNVFWAAASLVDYEQWWLNDRRTIPFFEAIRRVGNTITIPERTREEYYRQWDRYKVGDPEAFILEPYLTFGGGGYGSGGFGGKKGPTRTGYERIIRECHAVMQRTTPTLTALDWKDTLTNLTADDLVYLDPPYFNADVRSYKVGDLHHLEMAGILQDAKFKWVLSEYEQPFYNMLLGEPFYRKDVQLIGTDYNRRQGRRVECLWKNF